VTTDASGNWTATVPPGATTAAVLNPPAGTTQTEGTAVMTVTAVAGENTNAGINGYYLPPSTEVGTGDTATIGYWQNKNGQALIKSLNGGSCHTDLGNWLAATFPKMWGANAGSANNLAGKTNTQVAAYYVTQFKGSSPKLNAQVLAVAIATYVTKPTLAGGNMAGRYGFNLTVGGTGAKTYNVGSNGAAFGVANNTTLTVLQILQAANARAVNGVLYNGNSTLRNAANTVFTGINEAGDIL
jgi:hypothetical protein